MTTRMKFLIIALPLLTGCSFLLSQFWDGPACLFPKAAALGILLVLLFSKLLAGMAGIPFLV